MRKLGGSPQDVKRAGGPTIDKCYEGVDILMRTVRSPTKLPHRLEVVHADGTNLKVGRVAKINTGGPLCFSGNMIAMGRPPPGARRE
jgi:hypothetical protein